MNRQTELIPWNRFLGSLKVKKVGLCMQMQSPEIWLEIQILCEPSY
jgi:hypothetical protein